MYNDKKEARGTLITLAIISLFFIGLGVSALNFEPLEHRAELSAHVEQVKINQSKYNKE